MNGRLLLGVAFAGMALMSSLVVAPAYAASSGSPAEVQSGALVDASSEPSEALASAVALKFGHAVVAEADTTDSETVSALPDGSYQLVESTVPVRVETASGWVPIDTTLVEASNGRLVSKAADNGVEFGAGGNQDLARVKTPSGAWLDETAHFGALPTPTVSGSSATYSDVLPGVDLKLTATAEGMGEVLVVKSAAAASNPELQSVDFAVSGSALTSDDSGLSTVTAADGSTVIARAPMWWDSSDGSTFAGPAGNAAADPVDQSSSNPTITLDAQAAATTPGVQYPVYVDPDFTGGLQAYTYVDAAYPTQSYWDGAYGTGQQRTGYVAAAYSSDSRNHTARSLWQVDTSGVAGKHILGSTFSVTEDWSFSCTASEVDLYWSAGISPSTTWNAQPGLIQLLSSATTAHGYNSSCPTAAIGFSATAGVQAAANINATGLTLELKAANEASNQSWKRFTQAATITINYNSYPNVPSSQSVASPSRVCGTSTYPAFLNGTQAVKLQASITDPDAGNNSGNFALSSVGSGGALTAVATYHRRPDQRHLHPVGCQLRRSWQRVEECRRNVVRLRARCSDRGCHGEGWADRSPASGHRERGRLLRLPVGSGGLWSDTSHGPDDVPHGVDPEPWRLSSPARLSVLRYNHLVEQLGVELRICFSSIRFRAT